MNNWIALSDTTLPVASAGEWIVQPNCGATVVFTGTARDHAGDRTGVSLLEYEAYEEQVIPRLDALAAAMREKWPDLVRIVLIHRIGPVPITQAAVVVATSSPHRAAAFEAARFGIDTLEVHRSHLEEGGMGRRVKLGPGTSAHHRDHLTAHWEILAERRRHHLF